MCRRRSQLCVVALALLIASPASADWYKSEKDERSGIIVGAAVGGAIVKGAGDASDVGALGGMGAFRIGTVASPSLVWWLNIDTANYLVKEMGPGEAKIKQNQSYTLTVAGQYYVREALWARFGLGIGGFARRAQEFQKEPNTSSGLGFTSGIGVDVWFRRKWVINFEAVLSGARVNGGFITHAGLMLALTRY